MLPGAALSRPRHRNRHRRATQQHRRFKVLDQTQASVLLVAEDKTAWAAAALPGLLGAPRGQPPRVRGLPGLRAAVSTGVAHVDGFAALRDVMLYASEGRLAAAADAGAAVDPASPAVAFFDGATGERTEALSHAAALKVAAAETVPVSEGGSLVNALGASGAAGLLGGALGGVVRGHAVVMPERAGDAVSVMVAVADGRCEALLADKDTWQAVHDSGRRAGFDLGALRAGGVVRGQLDAGVAKGMGIESMAQM